MTDHIVIEDVRLLRDYLMIIVQRHRELVSDRLIGDADRRLAGIALTEEECMLQVVDQQLIPKVMAEETQPNMKNSQ